MIWIAIIIAGLIIDQLSKYIIKSNVEYGDIITVINNFFYITHHENRGAAWGIFQNGRYFFIVLTIILVAILGYFLYKTKSKMLKTSLAIIIGGAAGNFVDRVRTGGVVDFLDFYIGNYHFPTFNAADTFIVVGSIMLAIYMIFIYKEDEGKEKEKTEDK